MIEFIPSENTQSSDRLRTSLNYNNKLSSCTVVKCSSNNFHLVAKSLQSENLELRCGFCTRPEGGENCLIKKVSLPKSF